MNEQIPNYKEITPLIQKQDFKNAYLRFKKLCQIHNTQQGNFGNFASFLGDNASKIAKRTKIDEDKIWNECFENYRKCILIEPEKLCQVKIFLY